MKKLFTIIAAATFISLATSASAQTPGSAPLCVRATLVYPGVTLRNPDVTFTVRGAKFAALARCNDGDDHVGFAPSRKRRTDVKMFVRGVEPAGVPIQLPANMLEGFIYASSCRDDKTTVFEVVWKSGVPHDLNFEPVTLSDDAQAKADEACARHLAGG